PATESIAKHLLPAPDLDKLQGTIAAFTRAFQTKIETWRRRLDQIAQQRQKTVVWGAGSKGVMFLNLLKDYELIEYAVDLNPRKTGKFIPGTGQAVVAPAFLEYYRPDLVIIMNPIYEAEIRQQCSDLGLYPDILCG
ncbi:methyltransferase, partial [filamentous cyanobacterium CCP5]